MIDTLRLLSGVGRDLTQALREHRQTSTVRFLGKHVLADFYNCARLPDEVATIQRHMLEAANRIGATVVESVFHTFSPHGLSGVVVIAESHLAVHTWPEHRFASIDLFTCSPDLSPSPGFEYLKDAFAASTFDVVELPRGAGVATETDPVSN